MARFLCLLVLACQPAHALNLFELDTAGRTRCIAHDINSSGEIVGECDSSVPLYLFETATPQIVTGIQGLYPGVNSVATRISDNSTVVGHSFAIGFSGTVDSLGNAQLLPVGNETASFATDISLDGRLVVGQIGSPSKASFWLDGNLTNFGPDNSGLSSVRQLSNGNYLAVGTQFITINNEPRDQGLIVLIEPNGNYIMRLVTAAFPDPSLRSLRFYTASDSLVVGEACGPSTAICKPIWSNFAGTFMREFDMPVNYIRCVPGAVFQNGFLAQCLEITNFTLETFVLVPNASPPQSLRNIINTVTPFDAQLIATNVDEATGTVVGFLRYAEGLTIRAEVPFVIRP